jgi:hypothetical protein
MNGNAERVPGGLGLVANGSSRRWDVAVDESLDRENEWSLEIDGPATYLVFQLRDLQAVSEALDFLQSRSHRKPSQERPPAAERADSLTLGTFGTASVSLLWDNEDFPRCFLVVGPRARSTMRLSLDQDDIAMLVEALEQVVEGLPRTSGK